MVPWRSGDTGRRRHGTSVPRLRFAPVARRGNQDSFANRDENLYQRFIQEAQAASALNHPYIASGLVDGEPLRELVARGPVSIRKLRGLATQIAGGIVHRERKPENIMITRA